MAPARKTARKTSAKPQRGANALDWKITTISEHQGPGKAIWRSQFMANDKVDLLSIRKFVIKANGDEQVTNTGISITLDENTDETLDMLIGLLNGMKKFRKSKGATSKAKAKPADDEDEVDEEASAWVIKVGSGKKTEYLRGFFKNPEGDGPLLKWTDDPEKAKDFGSEAEVKKALRRVPKDLKASFASI
jgi:hypothetical protein